MKSGKFDEELSLMNGIVNSLTSHALIVFNELFAATNEREGSEIARQIVSALLERSHKVVFVSHKFAFTHGFFAKRLDLRYFCGRMPDFLLPLERLMRQCVELADRLRIAEAVLQRVLAVFDRREVIGSRRQHRLLRHVEDELVVDRHGREQRVELQVLPESVGVRRQGASEIEIALPMHEEGFHGASLSRNCL